jgi:hypothetical protein
VLRAVAFGAVIVGGGLAAVFAADVGLGLCGFLFARQRVANRDHFDLVADVHAQIGLIQARVKAFVVAA